MLENFEAYLHHSISEIREIMQSSNEMKYPYIHSEN